MTQGSDRVRVRIRFAGRVQGVGFRASVQALADRHGIVGWVRNEPDRSVLMESQGSPEAIDEFLSALRAERALAIESEQREDLPEQRGEGTFDIRR
jgi:acylphosphatase